MSTPIIAKETETFIKKLFNSKSPSPDGFTNEFYKGFNEKLIPILLKLFQNIENIGIFPSAFC